MPGNCLGGIIRKKALRSPQKGGAAMKGMSITGLVLGIVGTVAGIAAVVLSSIGLAKSR